MLRKHPVFSYGIKLYCRKYWWKTNLIANNCRYEKLQMMVLFSTTGSGKKLPSYVIFDWRINFLWKYSCGNSSKWLTWKPDDLVKKWEKKTWFQKVWFRWQEGSGLLFMQTLNLFKEHATDSLKTRLQRNRSSCYAVRMSPPPGQLV